MTYQLAKQLKDAGFPKPKNIYTELVVDGEHYYDVYIPTLSELIEACGLQMNRLIQNEMDDDSILWQAINWEGNHREEGKTPEEAVARLFLALNSDKIKK